MTDPHVSLNLTFRTPAAASVVLQHVLAAVNGSNMPYEFTNGSCVSFDPDEVED